MKGTLILRHQRENQLERQRTRYRWQHLADVAKPSGIDIGVTKLPSDEQFESTKQFSLLQRVLESKGALMTTTAFSAQHSLSNYEELARCLRTADIPIYARWKMDAEFGRQVLNGVNSVVIKKCTSLPENLPLQASSVEESLVRGLSLQDEMKVSQQFMTTAVHDIVVLQKKKKNNNKITRDRAIDVAENH